ncbi:FIP1[V]-like protein [Actinidia eriantha]|uniref:FIP1[V]-like protein n=1 Tax=Actinidia eriantha TaxID=165200 RepID=UPI00258B2A7D|nr:FIP1[V]-like protein [Actinidia eriantha]
MEDDDEFGDLYTDVLQQFQPSSALLPPPEPPTQPPRNRPIDLNVNSDDEDILFGATNSNPKFNLTSSHQTQTLVLNSKILNLGKKEDQKLEKDEGLAQGLSNWASDRVVESGSGVRLQERGFQDPNLVDESAIEFVVEEIEDKDDVLVEKDGVLKDRKEKNLGKFDVEEVDNGIANMGWEPMIPGVSDSVDHLKNHSNSAMSEGNDWDSDSEDDLQIVLNDNQQVPMVMDMGGVVGSDDDDDEDGDPLVIVADSEPGHQPMEEKEWGDQAAQAVDGEREELGDAAKVNGGVAIAPKIGYCNAYYPYHSQFKYVRPGAAPMPGASPLGHAGPPGQVHPPVNMNPVTGFGRGDWQPPGIKNTSPMQKNLHTGFGMPGWGNNTSGRGYGSGLDFTLPSHKTIFEVDIDSFEEKPWRLPGLDMSDFFNFGLNEESWKDYCKQLEQLRLETTMQSKICVYESGRTEKEYDPDLPPELAAAAGMHDISSENANHGKMDTGQSNIGKGPAYVRPPLPTGRAIQVETSYSERLPSIDTRPPRIRDSDSIIEIVLQDSADDDSFPGNDGTELPQNDPSREDFRGGLEMEGAIKEDNGHFDGFPHAYNGKKRELVKRRAPVMNTIKDSPNDGDITLPIPLEHRFHIVQILGGRRLHILAEMLERVMTKGLETVLKQEEDGSIRQTKGRACNKSPNMTCSGSTLDKRFPDNKKEDSVESIDGKHSTRLSSPDTVGSAEEPDVEDGDALHDELVLVDGSSGMDREEMALDRTTTTDASLDENPSPSVKKQKLSSLVEQSFLQETDDGDSKAARSTENSIARSESSRDYQRLRGSIDEEDVQHGRSERMGNLKRHYGEDEPSVRRQGHDERHKTDKHRMAEKGREESYSRRNLDPCLANHSHKKSDIDRRMDRDNSEGSWQRRDDDSHGRRARAEATRKQEHGDELGSRNRNKVRESEINKDEHLQSRKQLENGNSRGNQDRDVGSRHKERDDHLKNRYENVDHPYIRRRKEEDHLRRDAEKEEIFHGLRENTSRQKRERDDVLDLRKTDDQVRTRDDDHHSVKHKEDGWIHRERGDRQRERDEWHRLKKSHGEKRERERGQGGIRSGQSAEDRVQVANARVKDQYKSSDRDNQFKDTSRHNEQLKRRDQVEGGSLSQLRGREDVHAGGNQLSNDERRPRQERASTHSDRAVGGSDNSRVHGKKHKENTRKNKDSEGSDQNSMIPSKRNQEDISGHMNEPVIPKSTIETGKHREHASSEDEQQDSRRGRSKLERWTSHKERDFTISTKSSSSLKVKKIEKYDSVGSSIATKLLEESSKTVENIDNQHPLGDKKDSGDPEIKNVDVKPLEDRHLDTVARLKKRSERFKLPMPSEKEAMVIKKMESESLPSAQSEPHTDLEIKPERPARKRRWISN